MARQSEQTLERDTPDLGIPQEDPNVTIDLDAEDDEGGERVTEGDRSDDAEPGKGERVRDPKTGRWGDKKRQRGQDRRDQQSWRTEKTQLEARIAQQRQEHQQAVQQLQMRIDAMARVPAGGGQQQQTANPFTARFTDLESQLESELRLIEADPKRDYKRYNDLRRQETRLVAQEESWRTQQQANAQRPQQQTQQNPYAARQPFIESEFPWTMDPANGELCKRAAAIKQYLVNVEGRLDTIDTDREALSTAANRFGAQFGVRGAPADPSQRTRDSYASPGQRTAPRRGEQRRGQIDVPRALLNGSGLSAAAIADALRED